MWIRDGPLENLLGGGGRAKYKKKFAIGKIIWKKILARQLTLKNIHTRNLITKKNYCDSKIPIPPPYNFSFRLLAVKQYIDATSTYFC